MRTRSRGNLKLGSNVVELLLPHRRPFLMVDLVESYEREPQPRLQAGRHISANEEVFAGHFPELHLWPGVYTLEGLGQSCNLLNILVGLQSGWEQQGGDPEDVLTALRNLDLGFRLHPGFRPELSERLLEPLGNLSTRLGLSSSVEIKFLQPVFAGQRLDYLVSLTHEIDNMTRYEVEALADGKTVARGVMTSARGFHLPALGT